MNAAPAVLAADAIWTASRSSARDISAAGQHLSAGVCIDGLLLGITVYGATTCCEQHLVDAVNSAKPSLSHVSLQLAIRGGGQNTRVAHLPILGVLYVLPYVYG